MRKLEIELKILLRWKYVTTICKVPEIIAETEIPFEIWSDCQDGLSAIWRVLPENLEQLQQLLLIVPYHRIFSINIKGE